MNCYFRCLNYSNSEDIFDELSIATTFEGKLKFKSIKI